MRVADRCALQRFGLRAKTNFNYTRKELCEILSDIKLDTSTLSEGFKVTFRAYKPPEVLKNSKAVE